MPTLASNAFHPFGSGAACKWLFGNRSLFWASPGSCVERMIAKSRFLAFAALVCGLVLRSGVAHGTGPTNGTVQAAPQQLVVAPSDDRSDE